MTETVHSNLLDEAPPHHTPVFAGSNSWPHTLLRFHSGKEEVLHSAGGSTSTAAARKKSMQAAVKAALAGIEKSNRVLALACKEETAFCADLFETILAMGSLSDGIWQTIHEAKHLLFILTTRNPDQIVTMLPKNWGSKGYSNVCIAAILDSSPDENSNRISALLSVPAHFHALLTRPFLDPKLFQTSTGKVDWVIVDATYPISDFLLESANESTNQIRSACHAHGIAFFRNSPGSGTPTNTTTDHAAGPADHPFGTSVDLRRPSILAKESQAAPTDVAIPKPCLEAPAPAQSARISTATSRSPEDVLAVPDDHQIDVADLSSSKEFDTGAAPDSGPIIPPTDLSGEVAVMTDLMRFKELDSIARKGLKGFIDAGNAMMEIKESELWRVGGYDSWDYYCESVLTISRNYANRIVKGAEITRELGKSRPPTDSEGNPLLPLNESQVRPLGRLKDPRKRSKAWKIAVKRSAGMPKSATVIDVVCEIMAEDSPAKPATISRKAQRMQLLEQLRQAADSASLDEVREIVTQLVALN